MAEQETAMVRRIGDVIHREMRCTENPYSIARAVIEAMREPTQAMLNNACPVEDTSGAPYVYDRKVTAELYRGCIEAALI